LSFEKKFENHTKVSWPSVCPYA